LAEAEIREKYFRKEALKAIRKPKAEKKKKRGKQSLFKRLKDWTNPKGTG
jgi:hypothetical protein